ncbi:MAG: peptidase [Pseudonocardiales bacterium]|nr:peptidase [Pseudonocardiales bacterium]
MVGIGVRLVDAPVALQDDPRANVYIIDHLAPGAVIERRIEVSNTTAEAQRIALYAAAATVEDGTFMGSDGRTANDLSSWTSVTPGDVELPAQGTRTATVTITVPSDAAPGEQYGVVWAEARSDAATHGGVVQVGRVGIRLYVSVGPGGPPAADFTIDSLVAGRTPAGDPMISANVHNTGGRALDMTGTLELTDGPGGLRAGPFDATLGSTLGIDDTESVTIVLDQSLPAGPWSAGVHLSSGMVERDAEATVTFPEAGAAAPVATTGPGSGPPWPLVATLIAGLSLAIATLTWRRRRASRVPRAPRTARAGIAVTTSAQHCSPGPAHPPMRRT